MGTETIWKRLNRLADPRQVRWMAAICFASALITAWGAVFPYQEADVVLPEWLGAAAALLAGVLYWVLAPWFRVWTLHLVVTVGLAWGCSGLVEATQPTGTAVIFATLLWTGVYIAAMFPLRVVRIYSAGIFVGMVFGILVSGVEGGTSLAVSFGASIVITMELLGRATSQLRNEASTDPLTGLLNRNGLNRAAAPVIASGASGSEQVAVIHIDLDGFKTANDENGHLEGDRILVGLAEAWDSVTGEQDLLARIGGDEFVAVFPGVDRETAEVVLRQLREVSPIVWSVGLSMVGPGDDLEDCLARADVELYEEKARKRNPGGRAVIRQPGVELG